VAYFTLQWQYVGPSSRYRGSIWGLVYATGAVHGVLFTRQWQYVGPSLRYRGSTWGLFHTTGAVCGSCSYYTGSMWVLVSLQGQYMELSSHYKGSSWGLLHTAGAVTLPSSTIKIFFPCLKKLSTSVVTCKARYGHEEMHLNAAKGYLL
jgi:hypothetical protein